MTERIEGLLNRIPGYTGYRQKESMRDDDKRLRDEIARGLSQSVDNLTRLGSRLAADRKLDLISSVEDAIARVRQLESRVRTASYGYGGIFSDRSVDEHALTQLKQFDVTFQARVEELNQQFSAMSSGDTADRAAFDGIKGMVADLNKLFDSRGDVIETASPTNDPDVLALLEKPRVISDQASQLLSVRRGGTGAILGDNYQFTGHIALTSREGQPVTTLAELDGGPEWLAVIDDGTDVTAWRVREATGSEASPQAGNSASAAVAGPQGTESGVPATYDVIVTGSGDDADVRIGLSVAGKYRAYEGSKVPLIDLQVFSTGNSAS
jgi:hypothetical protein